MNDAENAILPAEAMHDASETNIKAARAEAICRGNQ
jgi:hypothetical protein